MAPMQSDGKRPQLASFPPRRLPGFSLRKIRTTVMGGFGKKLVDD
jgi:hypothetical protein